MYDLVCLESVCANIAIVTDVVWTEFGGLYRL